MIGDAPQREKIHANIELVRRLFEMVDNRGDPDDSRWATYASMYQPDVVIHEAKSLPYGGDYRGQEAVARHALSYNGAWDAFQASARRALEPRFFGNEDEVVVLWRQRGESPSGETFDMPAASVYRIRDGKVAESRMFHFDTAAARSFLERAQQEAQKKSVEA